MCFDFGAVSGMKTFWGGGGGGCFPGMLRLFVVCSFL